MKVYVILCLVSLVVAEDSVTYNSYNSSTVVPEINPNNPGHLSPMIVHQNSSEGNAPTDHAMHSHAVEGELELGTELPSVGSNISTLDSDFLSISSSDTGDSNATEPEGPTTKATHIMKIPIKNTTASDMSDTTDSSMEKEASAATSEHGDHSKAAGSSASAVVVLTLFILSSRVLQSQ